MFSCLAVEQQAAIPVWGILMSHFFPNLDAAQCACHCSLEFVHVQGPSPAEVIKNSKTSKFEPK